MENIMKKQSKKSPLGIFRSLLLAVLIGLGSAAFAQGVEVCAGTPYTIASTVDASGASSYQWLENGQIISGASDATYEVPSTKVAGLYTYIRQAKSADCSEWQPSNEFTVTVFACSFTAGTETGATATFTDPRDGKRYKTVVMPDGRTWFAQNLNYTKDLTYNAYAYVANGKEHISQSNGVFAIGSYWCPGEPLSIVSGSEADCYTYGAFYTWETAMMVDGKYADETKTSSAWDESWVSPYDYTGAVPGTAPHADENIARGGTTVKGGGRGICPVGWSVPTLLEWAEMLDSVEGDGNSNIFTSQAVGTWGGTDVGTKLKSALTCSTVTLVPKAWYESKTPGTDACQFTVVPSGYLYQKTDYFERRHVSARLLCSSAVSPLNMLELRLEFGDARACVAVAARNAMTNVRCIKD
jgi:uncharacterized protein (TIGR02145 family)